MERFTTRNSNGSVGIGCPLKPYNYEDIKGVLERLANIEDILGDTYDLDRLRELVEEDKAGRCVVFPCKPDDMVYIVCGFISEYEVKQLIYDGIFIWAWLVNEKYTEPYKLIKRCLDFDIGKTIFFTREAAKAALAKEGQNNADQKLYDENRCI